jgi:hypothetical protein
MPHSPRDPSPGPPRSHLVPRSRGTWLWIAWFLVGWAALQYPGWLIASRTEPFVLGIPFTFFWALVWWILILASIIALARRTR